GGAVTSLLGPKNGPRSSTPNGAWVGLRVVGVGSPPVNVACGSTLSGFAAGKNCVRPGSTLVRSLAASAASSNALVYWCDQLIPVVTSRNVVLLNVCSSVPTMARVSISYLLGYCGQPPDEPRNATPPPRFS